MLRLQVVIDAPQITLNYVAQELGNLRDFYEERVYPKMLRDLDKIFEDEGRPPWAALRPSTISFKQRYYPGMPILQREGILRDSYAISTHPDHEIEITARTISLHSSVEYAGLHESGTSNMKARPVVGGLSLDKGLRNQYNKLLSRHVNRIIKQANLQASRVGVRTAVGGRARRSRPQIREQTRVLSVGRVTRF